MASGLPLPPPTDRERLDYQRAMDYYYEKMEATGGNEELEDAHTMWKMSKYCTQAYMIFSDQLAANEGEALLFNRWAVSVGEVFFGQRFFELEKGSFYSIFPTRPYMRARIALAGTFRRLGCLPEAISHLEALLELDYNDHVGARMVLMTAYLEAGHFLDFKTLFDKHKENTSHFGAYSNAYYVSMTSDSKDAFANAARRAFSSNRHVPHQLKNPNAEVQFSPFGVSDSGPDGAADYLSIAGRLWKGTPKALKKLILEYDKWRDDEA